MRRMYCKSDIEIIAAICAIVVITKYSELEQAIAYQRRTDECQN